MSRSFQAVGDAGGPGRCWGASPAETTRYDGDQKWLPHRHVRIHSGISCRKYRAETPLRLMTNLES